MSSCGGDVADNMECNDLQLCPSSVYENKSSFELVARFSDSLSLLHNITSSEICSASNNKNVDKNVDKMVDILNADISKLNETEIRQSYNTLIKTHRQFFTKDMMIKLWDSWLKTITSFNSSYNIKLARIRAFVLDPEQIELKIHNHTSKSRQEYHEISSLLRLEHLSVLDEDKKQDKVSIENNIFDEQLNQIDNSKDNRWDVFKKNKISDGNDNLSQSTFKKIREKDIGKPQVYENFNIKHKHEKAEKAEIVKTLIIKKPENWRWEYTL
jgi:hypothetical protein